MPVLCFELCFMTHSPFIWVLSVLAALLMRVSSAQDSESLSAPLPLIQGEVNGMKVVAQGDTAAFFAGRSKPLPAPRLNTDQGSVRLHNTLQENRIEAVVLSPKGILLIPQPDQPDIQEGNHTSSVVFHLLPLDTPEPVTKQMNPSGPTALFISTQQIDPAPAIATFYTGNPVVDQTSGLRWISSGIMTLTAETIETILLLQTSTSSVYKDPDPQPSPTDSVKVLTTITRENNELLQRLTSTSALPTPTPTNTFAGDDPQEDEEEIWLETEWDILKIRPSPASRYGNSNRTGGSLTFTVKQAPTGSGSASGSISSNSESSSGTSDSATTGSPQASNFPAAHQDEKLPVSVKVQKGMPDTQLERPDRTEPAGFKAKLSIKEKKARLRLVFKALPELAVIDFKTEVIHNFLKATQFPEGKFIPVCETLMNLLPARDILSLNSVDRSTYQQGYYKNPLFIEMLLELYYTRSPATQAIYRRLITTSFGGQPPPNLTLWLQHHFTPEEQIWVSQTPLRTAALFRHLSTPAEVPCIAALKGHRFAIRCVTTLANGWLVSGAYDKTLRVWDPGQPPGQLCVAILTGHTGFITCVTTLENGWVVSGDTDRTLRIWNLSLTSGQNCIAILTGHTRLIKCVTGLPDNWLVSGSDDSTLKVWNPGQTSGQYCVATLTGHTDWVEHITVLPNGQLVSSSYDRVLKIWDLGKLSGQPCIATLKRGVCYTALPDGQLVLAFRKTIEVWDLNNPSGRYRVATLEGHNGLVRCIIMLPDGRLASGSSDKTLKIWDLSKTSGNHCVATLKGHEQVICAVAVLPCGRLVSGSDDMRLRIWDLDAAIDCRPESKL